MAPKNNENYLGKQKKKRKEKKEKERIFCGTQASLVIAALDQVLDEMESHGNQDLTTDPGQDSTNPEPPQPSNNQLAKPKAHFSRFQILTRSQSNQQSKAKQESNKMSTTSSNKTASEGTPTPPEPENHPDPPPVLRVSTPGEEILVKTVTSEAPLTLPTPMGSSVKKMFLELDEELNWSNDTLPPQLAKFLRDKLRANNKILKFFECNSLVTIREIAQWGSLDINIIISQFPNQHEDMDFIRSLVMIHHLTEFSKVKGEEALSKASALLTPSSSNWFDFLPANKEETDDFAKNIKMDDFEHLMRWTRRTFMNDLQQAMEDFNQGSTITSRRSRGDPKPPDPAKRPVKNHLTKTLMAMTAQSPPKAKTGGAPKATGARGAQNQQPCHQLMR